MDDTLSSALVKGRRPELLGMVLIALVITLTDKHGHSFWTQLPLTLVFTTVIWEVNARLLMMMQRRFPEPHQTMRRLLLQVPLHIVLTVTTSSLLEFLIVRVMMARLCTAGEVVESMLFSLVPTAFVALLYESRFFFNQWRHSVVRVEQLARAQAQSQLEALRSQLDPHFLFNSLNTLAALIDESPDAAQDYLSQLSDVYRYVLLAREKDTVTLEEELTFVDAYIYLNKTRFRDNLRVQISIPAELKKRRVAPLSLQLLVENALKHNVVSREHPLHLRVDAVDGETIRVLNTVRPKTTLTPGTRLGLKNLLSRYELLSTRPIKICHDDHEWSVALPLL